MGYGWDVLAGNVAVDLRPDQRSVFDHLMETWDAGERTEELLSDFTSLLTHEDPKLRSAAVEFFSAKYTDDGGVLMSALVDSPELYAGVPRHWYGGDEDLKSLMLMQCAKGSGSSEALFDVVKADVSVREYRPYALQVLVRFHEDWVRANLPRIVDGSADALRELLYAVRLCGKLPDPFLRSIEGIPEDQTLALVAEVFPTDLTRLTWMLQCTEDVEAAEKLRSPVWSVRLAEVRGMSGDPATVLPLARFSAVAIDGCEDLDCPGADGQDESIRLVMCMAALNKEIVSALVAAGGTEVGLYALFHAATSLYPASAGEACGRALGQMDPEPVYSFVAKMLRGRRVDVENIGNGVAATAMYFDGSEKAAGPLLKTEPRPLPEFLAMLRDNDLEYLQTLASGKDLFASHMGDLLRVLAEY